jgi:hypothetical protein
VSDGRARIERDQRGRRVREHDRHGAALATLAWHDAGGLAEAAVRIPDGSWLQVQPRGAHDPRWGASDVVHQGRNALTHFAAVDWAAVDAIPPLAEPARLPPGGGTAILNLIAAVAADQRRGPLEYRGPYPTEQLFLALLECFRYESAVDQSYGSSGATRTGGAVWGDASSPPTFNEMDVSARAEHPLELFMRGDLVWMPHAHERSFDPRGVYVQSRLQSRDHSRVEKIVWRGRAYYRDAWQGVERHAVHRLRDDGARVVGSLWALGEPLEDHVVLSREGDVLETRAPAAGAEPPRPLPSITAEGLVAIVIAGSAPALAGAIRAAAGELGFEWAALGGDLAAIEGTRARVSSGLLRALAARVAAAGSRAEQVRLGFAALTEAAQALGDALRAQGQAHLAAAGAEAQAEALGRTATDAAAAARRIGEAVERLLEEAAQLRA